MAKKDIFNGKILTEMRGMVYFTVIFIPILFCAFSGLSLWIALCYENVEPSARILLYVMAGLSLISAIVYPLATILLIRRYPKHRKITIHFMKEYVFRGYNDRTEKDFFNS